MKKIWMVPILLLGILLTGCSFDLDLFPSDTESKADAMGKQIDDMLVFLKKLEVKEKLTVQDQQMIVSKVHDLSVVMDAFIEEEAPLFQGVKEFAVKKLRQREETLLNIQERAKKGEVTIEDIKEMKNAISADMELSIFK